MSADNQISSHAVRNRRSRWGNRLFCFSAIAILLSSIVKFVHPPKPVEYLASMGYEGDTVYVIAAMEMAIAILCLVPATRRAGLLLISALLGGAVASHIAIHRSFAGGPFIRFMSYHPYTGALIPSVLLAMAWVGDYLTLRTEAGSASNELPPPERQGSQPVFDNVIVRAKPSAR